MVVLESNGMCEAFDGVYWTVLKCPSFPVICLHSLPLFIDFGLPTGSRLKLPHRVLTKKSWSISFYATMCSLEGSQDQIRYFLKNVLLLSISDSSYHCFAVCAEVCVCVRVQFIWMSCYVVIFLVAAVCICESAFKSSLSFNASTPR